MVRGGVGRREWIQDHKTCSPHLYRGVGVVGASTQGPKLSGGVQRRQGDQLVWGRKV